jgi:hypothetical protein
MTRDARAGERAVRRSDRTRERRGPAGRIEGPGELDAQRDPDEAERQVVFERCDAIQDLPLDLGHAIPRGIGELCRDRDLIDAGELADLGLRLARLCFVRGLGRATREQPRQNDAESEDTSHGKSHVEASTR